MSPFAGKAAVLNISRMFNHLSPVYKGILLALSGYTAFAICDICVKWLTLHYSVFQILTFENGLAVLILLALSPYLGGARDILRKENFKIHGLRMVLNFSLTVLLTYCYKWFPLADVYTVIFTKPFFAALLAIWLYKERGSVTRWLAIFIGFTGVVLAMRPGSDFNPFMLLPLGGACLIALLFVCARSLDRPSIFSLGFAPMAGAAALSFPLMLPDFTFPAPEHVPVFVLAGISSGIGIVCVSMAFRTTAASVVSPFLYVEMLWALVFGYLLFSDVPDLYMLMGAGIIIASGIYLVETERRVPLS